MPLIAKKLTWDDIKDLPEDAGRTEIVDGELFMAPPPSDRHQEIATALGAKIYPFVKTRGLGKFYSSAVHVILADHVNYEPDLCFLSAARLDLIRFLVIKGPPDLVIEILSGRTRKYDPMVKFHHYEQHGVREYWIVDPRDDRIHVHSLQDGCYISLGEFTTGELVQTRVLPGLDLDPAEIF